LTPNEPDIKKTFGYASLLDKNSTSITWSFTSKLKEEGKADNDKVYAIIDVCKKKKKKKKKKKYIYIYIYIY